MNKVLMLLLSILLSINGFTQTAEMAGSFKAQVMPPSAESAALAQYAAVPVSYYTGTPQINIPLYNVQSGSLSLPISLSYHASGIKVEQRATRAGIGWTLNAGGAITRSVFGIADDTKGKGFIDVANNNTYNIDFFTSGKDKDRRSEIVALSGNCLDAQPDVFYFNFNGMTGKFAFDWNGNIITDSKSKLKIEQPYRNPNNDDKIESWIVKDDHGNTYKFKAIEENEIFQGFGMNVVCPGELYKKYNSGWYLTEISDVNNQHIIHLEYEPYDIDDGRKNLSSGIIHDLTFLSTGCPRYTKQPSPFSSYRTGQEMKSLAHFIYHGVYVSKVWIEYGSYSDTIASFITEDYQENGFVLKKTLSKIVIKKNTTDGTKVDTVKNYDFDYDFSTGRLTLRSITENNKGDSLPPYKFNYCGGKLPEDINSKSQDHWGYYNGINNSTLVPEYKVIATDGEVLTYVGGDRSPHEEAMDNGCIKSVVFPTGGMQEFNFEPHTYGFIGSTPIPTQYDEILVGGNFVLETPHKDSIFKEVKIVEIPVKNGVNSYQAYARCEIRYEPSQFNFALPSANVYKCLNDDCSQTQVLCAMNKVVENNEKTNSLTKKYLLGVGKYKLEVNRNIGTKTMYARADLTYSNTYTDSLNPRSSKMCGGLRIASIIEKDHEYAIEAKRIRRFNYFWNIQAGRSSGVIYGEPKYRYSFNNFIYTEGQLYPKECLNEMRVTKSNSVMATTQGSHIGYRTVEEWNGADSTMGKTVYNYTSPYEFNDVIYPGPISQPPTSFSYKTGQLVQKNTYGNGLIKPILLRREKYIYGHNQTLVQGLKVWSPFKTGEGEGEVHIPEYKTGLYKIIAGRSRPTETKVIDFSEDGLDSITTVTTFNYDTKLQYATQKTIIYNENLGEQTEYYYPHDFVNPSPEIKEMTDRNWISAPLEIVSKTKNNSTDSFKVTGATFLKPYRSTQSQPDLYFPKSISTLKIASPLSDFQYAKDNNNAGSDSRYDIDNTVNFFNNNGLPLEVEPKSGLVESYCYNKYEQPIAKVANAKRDEIFYHGFSEDGDCGCLNIGGGHVTNTTQFSGQYSYTGVLKLIRCNVVKGEPYLVSFWARVDRSSDSLKVKIEDGKVALIDSAFNLNYRWKRYSFEVIPNSNLLSVTINTPGYLDELRGHPKDAEMLTYNHDYLIGPISMMEQNGKPTHYEYDNLNRLRLVRDYKRGILKRIAYNYGIYNTKPIDKDFKLTINKATQSPYTYSFKVSHPTYKDTFKYQWDFGDDSTATIVDTGTTNHTYIPLSVERSIRVKIFSKTKKTFIKELVGTITINNDSLCQQLGEIKKSNDPVTNPNGVKMEVNNIPGLTYTWTVEVGECDEKYTLTGPSVKFVFPNGNNCKRFAIVNLAVKIGEKVCTQTTIITNPK